MPDLVIVHAKELATPLSPDGKPLLGDDLRELFVLEDAAVVVENGNIAMLGPTRDVLASVDVPPENILDASGKTIIPGFVDPHTHLIFGGAREKELVMKIEGKSYMEILEAGGGILNTLKATRNAGRESLLAQSRKRLDRMLAYGTTTAEAKSGYGLDMDTEILSLEIIGELDRTHPVDLVPTFLGAHLIPPEYKNDPDGYVNFVIEKVLPVVASQRLARFCDVFCEKGAFNVEQSQRILQAAKDRGLEIKAHVDELVPLGGSRMVAEMGARSAEHLVETPDDAIEAMARSGTAAVFLPGTPFVLMTHHYPRARNFIEAGVPVALATDLNPNCWTESMQMIITLACLEMKLTPPEALTASTLNAAYALGLSEDRGSLEVGKRADLLILDAPGHLHLGYHFGINLVEAVVKGGQVSQAHGLQHGTELH